MLTQYIQVHLKFNNQLYMHNFSYLKVPFPHSLPYSQNENSTNLSISQNQQIKYLLIEKKKKNINKQTLFPYTPPQGNFYFFTNYCLCLFPSPIEAHMTKDQNRTCNLSHQFFQRTWRTSQVQMVEVTGYLISLLNISWGSSGGKGYQYSVHNSKLFKSQLEASLLNFPEVFFFNVSDMIFFLILSLSEKQASVLSAA